MTQLDQLIPESVRSIGGYRLKLYDQIKKLIEKREKCEENASKGEEL